jgi:hypothetical protein
LRAIVRKSKEMQNLWLAVAVSFYVHTAAANASSIEFGWDESYKDKQLLIESGFTTLYAADLSGDKLVVDTDEFLKDEVHREATVAIRDHDELSLRINLFPCSAGCRWSVRFSSPVVSGSTRVKTTCTSAPTGSEQTLKKYYFCRSTYKKYLASAGTCWPEAVSAVTGWFEAAYNLHLQTRQAGMSFFARDTDAEAYINDAMLACPDFESDTRRKTGYFRGMMKNLDVAVLQQAQRVQILIGQQRDREARLAAEKLMKEVTAVQPIRRAVPPRDAAFVESVINRALAPSDRFTLH